MIDINELRQLAQVATPGPWLLRTVPTSAGLCHIISAADWRGAFIYGDGLRIGVDDSLPKAQELAANAHLIAAANPAVISELLNRLEAAEKERDDLRAKIEQMEKQVPVGEIQRANSTGNYNNSVVWVPMVVGSKLYALPGAQGEEK